ncbi:hypothetical protein JCM10213_009301 [Rhodosporidiobolus nylandii]
MSRPVDDAEMGFAEEDAAPSSQSSNAGDDLLTADPMEEDDQPRSLRPTSSSAPFSPSSRSTGGPPRPLRSSRGSASARSRLARAAEPAYSGGGAFDRERARMAGGSGGGRSGGAQGYPQGGYEDGDGRSAEENVLMKVVDKDYRGRLTFDPFLAQVQALAASSGKKAPGSPSASAPPPGAPPTPGGSSSGPTAAAA